MNLTPAIKRAITNHWASAFPLFGIYKPLWLMRRYGPVLIGISLERDSGNDRYLPTSHLHNLARDLPAISLTMPTRLVSDRNNAVRKIQVKNHDRDWREAAGSLKAQSFVPLDSEAIDLEALIGLYTTYIRNEGPMAKYPIELFEDIFALQIWCGRSDEANSSLGRFRKFVDSWPPNIVNKFGGGAAWEQSVIEKYSSQQQLFRSAEARIVDLKLSNVPEGPFNLTE